LTADGYGKLIGKLCTWADTHSEGKVALFLEGGYDLNAGKACSLAVVSAMLDRKRDDPYPCPYQENNAWRLTLKKAQSIWKL
jgi:acetoin utilization deacetylase AcuC-like enzyme